MYFLPLRNWDTLEKVSVMGGPKPTLCSRSSGEAHLLPELPVCVQVKRVTVLLYRPTHLHRKPHQLPLLTDYFCSTFMKIQRKITRNVKRKKIK